MDKEKIKAALHEYLDDEEDRQVKLSKKYQSSLFKWGILTGIGIILILVMLGSPLVTTPHSETVIQNPTGKISSPATGLTTSNQVPVTGKTENIEPGQHVWLAVDKPDLGLCWPKEPGLKPNCSFSTVIYEGGPKEPYTLSLYIVNKTVNDQWEEWLGSERLGGLPMPPDKRRLDSVKLVLGG